MTILNGISILGGTSSFLDTPSTLSLWKQNLNHPSHLISSLPVLLKHCVISSPFMDILYSSITFTRTFPSHHVMLTYCFRSGQPQTHPPLFRRHRPYRQTPHHHRQRDPRDHIVGYPWTADRRVGDLDHAGRQQTLRHAVRVAETASLGHGPVAAARDYGLGG